MKNILISGSAATAIVAIALVLAPGNATASPVKTLASMKSALARAVQSGELTFNASVSDNGTITVTGLLDGQPFPADIPLVVQSQHKGNTYDVKVTADLSPASYSSISYGNDQSTLELIPKDKGNDRLEIRLDPLSLNPISWTSFTKDSEGWKVKDHGGYKPKTTGAPDPSSTATVTAHMRIIVAPHQSASLSIKSNGN
ncbi:MAG TPA: hypothetical protein VGL56_13450 [Fimbriimonadaceae bacterium]